MAKLVRDEIPAICEANGDKRTFRVADPEEMHQLLLAKFREEGEEFLENPNLEELTDVYEVILALVESVGAFEFFEASIDKYTKRGGFSKRIVMED
jgi:predicted house-cleaning noncanonical NTP pyrophosphatase (MazG superfamily)